MEIKDFMVGPQLIGLLFVLIGLMQKYLPPKKINGWYGYRTATAKSSQQLWDEGNRYSALYMIKAGLIVLVIGYFINAASILYVPDAATRQWISYVILFGGAMGIGILSTMSTEKHLKKNFKVPPVKPANKKRK